MATYSASDVTHQAKQIRRNSLSALAVEEKTMHVKLTATYFLTTDHAKSRFGQPVLVNRATGQAFLPGDAFAPYESWQIMKADQVVKKMASWGNFSRAEQGLIEQFLRVNNPSESPMPKEKEVSRDTRRLSLKWQSR